MERDRISFPQTMALLFGALMAPAAELLPGPAARAGAAGALGVTAAAVLLAAGGLLAGSLAGEKGLASGLLDAFGEWGGRAVLTIYIVWFELLLALRLYQSGGRLSRWDEQDGGMWYFVLILAAFALWMGRGRLGALGRTAQLFFAALCVAGGLVLVFSLARVRPERLLSHSSWSTAEVGQVLLPGWQALGYGLFATFLWTPGKESRTMGWLRSVSMAWLVLVVMQLVILSRFGPGLTMEWPGAFFQLAEGIGVKGAFQRVESLVAAVWVFSDLLLLGGLLWGVRRIGGVLCPGLPADAVVAVGVGLAAVVAVTVSGGQIAVGAVEGYLIPAGNLILGVAVPGLAWLARGRKRKI